MTGGCGFGLYVCARECVCEGVEEIMLEETLCVSLRDAQGRRRGRGRGAEREECRTVRSWRWSSKRGRAGLSCVERPELRCDGDGMKTTGPGKTTPLYACCLWGSEDS